MGTNYYLVNSCSKCGNEEQRHIGKSSVGWTFALCTYPDEGIESLNDWHSFVSDGQIVDEYGNELEPWEMLLVVCVRASGQRDGHSQRFLDENHAESGPNGLLRRRVEGICVGHGEGTWDLMDGEFS